MVDALGQALTYAMLAVVAALVGGLIAIYRPPGPQMESNVQHFAAGVVFAAVAAELLAVGILGLRTLSVPRGVSRAALAAGLGYVGGIVTLSATYALSLPVANPAFLLAAALAFGGIVAWSVRLGGELRSLDRQTRQTAGAGGRQGRL